MQGSDAGRLRDPRVPRIPTTAVLACWALGALVFAFLPQGAESKSVIATVFSLSTAAFAAVILLRAAPHAEGHERAFLRLMGLGMVFRFAGNSLWSASQHLGLGIVTPVAADFLRQRLRKFEEYFGVKTHDDTQAPSTC